MLNKAQIIGNLGRDPEIRTFSNGGRICRLSVATTEYWKDKKTGERKERTEWHRVSVISEPMIEFIEKHFRKGMMGFFEGKLQTSNYTDKDNIERYSTEIVISPYNGIVRKLTKTRSDEGAEVPEEEGMDIPEEAF